MKSLLIAAALAAITITTRRSLPTLGFRSVSGNQAFMADSISATMGAKMASYWAVFIVRVLLGTAQAN